MRAVTQRHTGESLIAVTVVLGFELIHLHRRWCGQQVPTLVQPDLTIAIGQQPAMADSLESRRQNVQQEAANELSNLWTSGHRLESTVRYLGIEVEDALEMSEQTEI